MLLPVDTEMMMYKRQTLAKYFHDHALNDPEKVAIYFYGNEFTYGWIDESSDALALNLASSGVGKGDVVAVYMQNCPQFVVAYLAIQKIGAVVSPCNPMLKSRELAYQLSDLGAVALIASAELVNEFENASGHQVKTLVVTSFDDVLNREEHSKKYNFKLPGSYKTSLKHLPWSTAIDRTKLSETQRRSVLYPEVDLDNDCALIIYTSGTTGSPKGAMLSHTNCVFKANCVASTYKYSSDDRVSAAMPIFHVAGKVVGMTSVFVAGASMVLQSRFDADDFITMAVDHGMTFSYTTPPMNAAIIATGRAEALSKLRMSIGTSFGSQITESLSDQWRKHTGQEYFEFAYGMSETHTADTMTPPGGIVWGSTGRATYHTDIRITDPEDRTRELAVGELGEISIKSPAVFLGYKDKPDATAAVKVDGRYYTGDMGRMDENGYLFFDGRFKEMIKSNGYSVFPEEVEKYLQEHPSVKQAVAVGFADGERGESVRAFIVLHPEYEGRISEAEIISWAKENMAAYKYPRSVRFIDKVPETATGKMLRAKLRDEN